MASTDPTPEPPPVWVWDDLTDEQRGHRFTALADWVGWLETTYAPWVTLPACWPLHEALRTELTMHWAWHRLVSTSLAAPAEGVRWHHELRRCAEAWRALADCPHEPLSRQRVELGLARRRQTEEFLRQALRSPAPNPHRRSR